MSWLINGRESMIHLLEVKMFKWFAKKLRLLIDSLFDEDYCDSP